jgi:hypothetical protein
MVTNFWSVLVTSTRKVEPTVCQLQPILALKCPFSTSASYIFQWFLDTIIGMALHTQSNESSNAKDFSLDVAKPVGIA